MTDSASIGVNRQHMVIMESVRHGAGRGILWWFVMNPYPNDHVNRSCQGRTPVIVLVLVLLCGVLGIVTVPPGSTPDVWAHVYRVDAMLNGDVIARPVRAMSDYHPNAAHNTGGWVNDDVIAFSLANDRHYVSGLVDAASITVNDGHRSEVPFDNTAVYPPIAYLPQLSAFVVGRLLHLNVTWQFYLAEVFQLAVYLMAVWIGLRVLAGIPSSRWFRMLAGLLAVCLALPDSFMFSPDSTVVALSLPLTCMLIRCLQADRLEAGDCVLLIGLTGILALSKFAYAPCLLMALMPIITHRRMPMRSRLILVAGCVLSVMLLLTWLKFGTGFATNPSRVPYNEVLRRQRELLAAPHRFLPRMFYSIVRLQGWSWWEPPLLFLFWMLALAALMLTVIVWRRDRQRLLFWLMSWTTIMGCVTLVYVAIWTQFTLTGQAGVVGINSRYFLPLVPPLAMQCADALHAIRENLAR
ncbi:DUF2142 domain-containing protein [Bifidobacterium scaligerum]|uniref:DUF2142 domain-containing protein n=1 Tax=Bifidobacterium scaligerum TaxID=2052656 RepID=A0A2M9HQB2_9BIFI|nr:DUF2142 domain-containing protein [Bifidobacterium scaligerum]PJM79006.1 hypothetical protein CUU80_06610 [Bifidobacterium scaligerum]